MAKGSDVAVFSRNHLMYLDEACEKGAKNPSERIVFRATVTWAKAEKELDRLGPLPIYLAPIGGVGDVEYVAELCGVLLKPVPGSPQAKKWLADVLPSTASEGLWHPTVNTLYAIRACRMLRQPFPMTRLVKLSDGKP